MKKTIKYSFFFILFSQVTFSFSADTKTDSLLKLLQTCNVDSDKVNLLFKLGGQYEYFKSKERIEHYISALNLATKINYVPGIIKTSSALITNLTHRQLFDVALEYCINYLDFLKTNGLDEELKKTYKIYATLLSKEGKYKESLEYNFKALNYYLSINNETQYATVLNNICLLHLNNKQADSAYLYAIRAVDIFRKNNKQSEMANSILGLSEICLAKKDLRNARLKAMEAFEIYTAIKLKLGLLNASFVIGNINSAENKFDSAIVNYDFTLKLLNDFSLPEINRDCYLNLSKCYYAKKNTEKAYLNHLLFSAYNDSVSTERFKAMAMEMDVKYSIAKKENELLEKDHQLESKNNQQLFLLIGIACVLILLTISYVGYKQKKKANQLISEQKRLVDEKQKEILDSIHYAKRIQTALITNEKYFEKTIDRLKNNG